MRVLTWNIRAGGGSRIVAIAGAIATHQADVLVLTEYRSGVAGAALRAALRDMGYAWMSPVLPPPGRNGVLIAAKTPPRGCGIVTESVAEPWRLVTANFGPARVFGVYMPNLKAKIPYWEALIAAAAPHAGKRALAIGDFNTCRAFVDEAGATDVTAPFINRIEDAGYRDVWRDRFPDGREFSWFSHRGNGFRVDHAFASRGLSSRIGEIRYSHAERAPGLSDHAALVLEIAPRTGRLPAKPRGQVEGSRANATPSPMTRDRAGTK